jgi:serine phosphatase RsbU (regulator of sigma subunit)
MLARTSRRQQRQGLAHVAHTLERSLLPDALPSVPGLQLASFYRPATAGSQAGGDFYDAFAHAGACWLCVGDICGKDADAAALTAMVRHSIRALAFTETSPARVLRTVNDVMLSHQLSGRFATAILARIDLASPPLKATLSSAGHPAPLLLQADGHAFSPPIVGTLLGVLSQPTLTDVDIVLPAGATLILHTDGLTDAGAPTRPLSTGELCQQLARNAGAPSQELVHCLEDLAISHGQHHLRDDIAILAARVT